MSQASPIKTYLWQLAKAAVAALGIICVSRYLGASGRGEWGLYLFYLQLCLMLVEFVAGSAVANWIARYGIAAILPYVFLAPVAGSLLLSIAWPYLGWPWEQSWFRLQFLALAFLNIQYNLYQAQGWVERRNSLQWLLEFAKFVGFAGLLYLWSTDNPNHEVCCGDQKLDGVIRVVSIAIVGVLLISMYRTHRLIRASLPKKPWPKGLLKEGFWAQVGHLLLYLVYRLPIWTLNQRGESAEAGVFSNALLVADAFWLFANSFGSVLHSRVLRSANRAFHARLVRRYTLISLMATTAACLVLVFVPASWFIAVFGEDFDQLKMRCVELIPAIICLAGSASLGHYLHAEGAFKALALSYGTSLLALLIGLEILPYIYALDVAFAVLLVINGLQVRRRLDWSAHKQNVLPLLRRWWRLRF
jgi:O-antigen/teichoic acid export membrane protein